MHIFYWGIFKSWKLKLFADKINAGMHWRFAYRDVKKIKKK